jgi:hypothetical protein
MTEYPPLLGGEGLEGAGEEEEEEEIESSKGYQLEEYSGK